jgi:hypothetical protein
MFDGILRFALGEIIARFSKLKGSSKLKEAN